MPLVTPGGNNPKIVLDAYVDKTNFDANVKDIAARLDTVQKKLIEKQKQIEQAAKQNTMSWKEVGQELSKVGLVIAGIGLAMKKAFDLGKEGAMLEFTATKFDRLSESIGTTSDALMRDLKKATGGIYSDMELMASTTDLVGLGLAKTHDEAVRLAKVSGGLNMNMNQLVLTLTNMTTMRFDALGVSTDGFKEKVKELEKAGYSANDAFKEAFLQQAEMQLEKVGNAADTTLGTYMRFEAAIKNTTDTMKRSAGDGLEPLVGWLTKVMVEEDKVRTALSATNEGLYQQWQATHQLTPEMERVVAEYQRAEQYSYAWETALRSNNTVIDESTVSIEDMTKANEALMSLTMSIQGETDKYTESLTELTEKQKDIALEIENATIKYGANSTKVAELTEKYDETTDSISKLELAHQKAMKGITYDLIIAKLKADGFSDAEYEIALAAGVALGQIDKATAETALNLDILTKTALEKGTDMEEFGDITATAMEDGVITSDEFQDALDKLNTETAQSEVALLLYRIQELSYTIGTIPAINVPVNPVPPTNTPPRYDANDSVFGGQQTVNIYGPVTMMIESDALIGGR